MGRQHPARHALNAGQISRYALFRTDLERLALAAETQTNLLPTILGPAIYCPGTQYLGSTDADTRARIIPFVFSVDEKALIELTGASMRVWVDDALVTRTGVTATVANGDFTTNLASWTDEDESGATSAHAAGGYMSLTGTGNSYAIRRQEVTVTETGTEHALRVVIEKGPVELRVGSAAGGDQYLGPYTLEDGQHSLAFTPTGNFHIEVRSATLYPVLINSINVEGSGIMELPTPWTGQSQFMALRFDQSGDVIFCAVDGIQQRRIERRSQRSWSLVKYKTGDGPFRLPNLTRTTLTPSDTTGQVTLTASSPVFKSGHTNALFSVTHGRQEQSATVTGEDQWTEAIRVSGLSTSTSIGTSTRRVDFVVTGLTGTGSTVKFQQSFGTPGAWSDFGNDYTIDQDTTFNDGLDNQIVYYRMGVKAGDYSSGTISITISNTSSAQRGIGRVVTVSNATTVTVDVLKPFADTVGSSDWEESEWSDFRGWPTATRFHDGRLWWGWRDRVYGSVSDDYHSFDYDVEGDAGPIQRSVATGAYEGIYWMESAQRLLCGTASQEVSIRSSSFDEPLTPTQFTARATSNRGSMNKHAVMVDSHVLFVQRGKQRVYALSFSTEAQDYAPSDLTRLNPEICSGLVRDIAVQRQPDTRIWFVLEDGTCAVLTYEPNDDVFAWTPITTEGSFESICVLPGDDEDEVYFTVNRTIDSSTVRYVEKLAKESECVGADLSKNIDCHLVYSGTSTSSISGLGHLEGEDVVVWANGKPLHDQSDMLTVTSGSISGLNENVTSAVVGLPKHDGEFLSGKLAYAAGIGSALSQTKRVDHVGLAMADVGWRGVSVGRDLLNLQGLPLRYRGPAIAAGTHVIADYDDTPSVFNGSWGADSRVAFKIQSPYPGRFLGFVIEIDTSEGVEGLGGERRG